MPHCMVITSGFNGAALFQVRKSFSRSYLPRGIIRFNGAALFQVRKFPLLRYVPGRGLASMGPHFFKCGSAGSQLCGRSILGSFNGAALFQVRKFAPLSAVTSFTELQWGRTFSSAEVAQEKKRFASEASMGPHFFKCGSERFTDSVAEQSASMGPHFFKCGSILRPGKKYSCISGFASMGPHFFKCGSD